MALQMNRSWSVFEKAPEGTIKNIIHSLGVWLLSRVRPSEIFLKSVSKDVTKLDITYPMSLNPRLVRRRLRHIALRGAAIHRQKFYCSTCLLPLTNVFTILPLPNVPFFWMLFCTYSNWRALQRQKMSDCQLPRKLIRACPVCKYESPLNSKFSSKSTSATKSAASGTDPATKKKPRARPNLTADLLLSDDGLGYVLLHFPRGFKYHGRGHEVNDLGNLIGLYLEWHKRLIPFYSFDQFVHKVEQVGASKRVRRCIEELRQRVARGGDPTKLHEAPVEEPAQEHEPDEKTENDPFHDPADLPHENTPAANDPVPDPTELVDPPEDMLDEVYHKATKEPEIVAGQEVTQPISPSHGQNTEP
ncbi:TIMELESS-interacting protein [Rhynchospora pubera]|uniref:TIMELESS-interacting protein n=1 Tax=Rhynchospora pubera TaxID=906938 RepID=A0AAV8E9U5_9POAL|nr:TIMELESS-interacting protein [Rhynchospora pubera]